MSLLEGTWGSMTLERFQAWKAGWPLREDAGDRWPAAE